MADSPEATETEILAFFSAAQEGNLRVVKQFIQNHRDQIDTRDLYGCTALVQAARFVNINVVRALLEGGADPNSYNQYGQTALMWAAARRDQAMVELLLERGADLSLANRDGQTALTLAAALRELAIVRLLLERGADPNSCDQYGETALIGAAARGALAMVGLLLERGADPDARTEHEYFVRIGLYANVTANILARSTAADAAKIAQDALEAKGYDITAHAQVLDMLLRAAPAPGVAPAPAP